MNLYQLLKVLHVINPSCVPFTTRVSAMIDRGGKTQAWKTEKFLSKGTPTKPSLSLVPSGIKPPGSRLTTLAMAFILLQICQLRLRSTKPLYFQLLCIIKLRKGLFQEASNRIHQELRINQLTGRNSEPKRRPQVPKRKAEERTWEGHGRRHARRGFRAREAWPNFRPI